jgi:hypothetical protein
MKILAFIIDPKLIRQILDHLDKRARPSSSTGIRALQCNQPHSNPR